MTQNPPRVKAGGLPPTQLHRVDATLLKHDEGRAVGGSMLDDMPIQYAGQEPDDEDGPEEMLAAVIVLTLSCLAIGSFIAGWMTWAA